MISHAYIISHLNLIDGWSDGWMDGWINRWVNGWMDGWIIGLMKK